VSRIDQRGEIGSGDDLEQLFLGRKRFEQAAASLDQERCHTRHGFLFERGANQNVGIENDPHPERG